MAFVLPANAKMIIILIPHVRLNRHDCVVGGAWSYRLRGGYCPMAGQEIAGICEKLS